MTKDGKLRLDWRPLKDWTRARLVGHDNDAGLLRFKRNGVVVCYASEARSVANYRRFLTPAGSWQPHPSGRCIHAERFDLTMDYAILKECRWEIERIRDLLIARDRPDYNNLDRVR